MDTQRHAGRVAVVTGAANGIGRALAARLAREGATVVGCNVSEQSRAKAEAFFAGEGLDVRLVRADISVQEDVDALVAAAGPRIDLLANVAGVMDNYLPLGDLDDATWARVVDVNLTGVMRVAGRSCPSCSPPAAGRSCRSAPAPPSAPGRPVWPTPRPSTGCSAW